MADNPARSTVRAGVYRLAFELVVIFMGVSAAFAVSEYREKRQTAERREQITQALVREIEDITNNTRNAANWAGALVAQYDSAFALAQTPPLQPMIEPVRVRPHMWEATLEAGGLELLDVATIWRISQFYNALNAGFEQLAQLRELSENVLIPNLGAGTSEFYVQPGVLRAKYAWYMTGVRNLHRIAQHITAHGDSIVAELGSGARPAADMMPDRS